MDPVEWMSFPILWNHTFTWTFPKPWGPPSSHPWYRTFHYYPASAITKPICVFYLHRRQYEHILLLTIVYNSTHRYTIVLIVYCTTYSRTIYIIYNYSGGLEQEYITILFPETVENHHIPLTFRFSIFLRYSN